MTVTASTGPRLMIAFMVMKHLKISVGGQVSVPAEVRHRWGTSRLRFEDLGDRVVLSPAPDDPVRALRGAFAASDALTAEEMRAQARREDTRRGA